MSSGERSAVVSACMQPPSEQRIAELPRRRARTSLHSSSVLERMRTTSPSDRSVCSHATCGEKRRRGEHLHAAPICVLAGHLEARPLPNGSHSIKRHQGRSYLEARAPCPMEAIQSSAIKRNQGRSYLEARAPCPMERGAHERRVERRAHVLVRRRLEHSRLALKRHKAQSVVISRHQWPISGETSQGANSRHQSSSVADQRPSEATRGPSEGYQRAIRGPSEGHQRAIRGHQRPPEVIRGHQQPSEVIRGPSTAIAPVRQRGGAREPRGTPGRPRAPTAAWALS